MAHERETPKINQPRLMSDKELDVQRAEGGISWVLSRNWLSLIEMAGSSDDSISKPGKDSASTPSKSTKPKIVQS